MGVTDPIPLDDNGNGNGTGRASHRPVHLRWRYLALVFLGGAIGTCARYLVSLVIPNWLGVPAGIFCINVVGAFALGALLESLSHRGADEGRRRDLRLLAGTGILGGFTTYSSLAVGADGLFVTGQFAASAVYAVATILVGGAASLAGIALSGAIHRRAARRALRGVA